MLSQTPPPKWQRCANVQVVVVALMVRPSDNNLFPAPSDVPPSGRRYVQRRALAPPGPFCHSQTRHAYLFWILSSFGELPYLDQVDWSLGPAEIDILNRSCFSKAHLDIIRWIGTTSTLGFLCNQRLQLHWAVAIQCKPPPLNYVCNARAAVMLLRPPCCKGLHAAMAIRKCSQ